jgi:hypothetical protein
MIEEYVNKLIENLPKDLKINQRLDLILDGGAFNGSYLIGALYFLKEMEKRDYIKIERISGCSIGSLVAFLYYIDSLDLMTKVYDKTIDNFKNNYSLNNIKNIKKILEDRIPNDICSKINGKLFICYNNIKTNKKIIKSKYKNIDEIIETIIKSCYIPFLIDNNILYKKKYIDGINAYLFKKQPSKKILHMELMSYGKIFNSLSIKNEKTNFHRVLEGLLDIHSFYIKKTNTPMCSFVENWNLFNIINYKLKILLEKILIYIIILFLYLNKLIPIELKNNIIFKIISKISFDIFGIFLETYCL